LSHVAPRAHGRARRGGRRARAALPGRAAARVGLQAPRAARLPGGSHARRRARVHRRAGTLRTGATRVHLPARPRLRPRSLLHVGRIVESKNCAELFAGFARWRRVASSGEPVLALIGDSEMPIPRGAGIRHLGRVSDQDKWDALAGCAAFVMPSLLESLSLVILEAWAAGRPVIVSARSPVLAGMARRSRAGLAYSNPAEFAEICELLIEIGRAHV